LIEAQADFTNFADEVFRLSDQFAIPKPFVELFVGFEGAVSLGGLADCFAIGGPFAAAVGVMKRSAAGTSTRSM
jgi:hypothetical protein